MNDLKACLIMHVESLERDCIIKQFWIEKKITPLKKKQRVFFNTHTEQEINYCSAYLECH